MFYLLFREYTYLMEQCIMAGNFENHMDRRIKEIHERMLQFKQRKKQINQR